MMMRIFIDYKAIRRSTNRDAWRYLFVLFASNEGKDSCLHLNAFSRGYGIKKSVLFFKEFVNLLF